MLVTLEEMKNYLRVDDDEDDGLITTLLASAERMCMDILRTDEESGLQEAENGKTAVMYTVAYLYEHREEADHHALNLTLRALLFGSEGYGLSRRALAACDRSVIIPMSRGVDSLNVAASSAVAFWQLFR